jgi:hypothetical protein
MSVHVMMDLETFGTAPGSALRSIGAVTFDPYEEFQEQQTFYANIDLDSCTGCGLNVDPKTAEWWSTQPWEARQALLTNPCPLAQVVMEFHAWWHRVNARFLWSNGANFDEVLWRVACKAVGVEVPWKYWNVRDTRTIWDIAGVNHRKVPRAGTAHNAFADAKHQADCVKLAYAKLRLSRAALNAPMASEPSETSTAQETA